MIARPRLKHFLRAEVVPPEGVFLLAETEEVLLPGPLYCELIPLLTGTNSVEQILSLLQARYAPAEIFVALTELRRGGYLTEGQSAGFGAPLGEDQAAFWEMLDADPAVVMAQNAQVELLSLGAIDVAPMIQLLAAVGIRACAPGWPAEPPPESALPPAAGLCVVVTDDYLNQGLEAQNRACLAWKQPWMLVRPVGVELWLGPLFLPGSTGCWQCLRQRLRGLRKTEAYLDRRRPRAGSPAIARAALPSTRLTALSLAATEIAKLVVGGRRGPDSRLAGRIITLNTDTLEQREHLLTRLTECPACGVRSTRDPRRAPPLPLGPCTKQFTTDGGHRTVSPEQTVERLGRLLSPITGIVASLRPLPQRSRDGLAPSYVAEHAFAAPHAELPFLAESLHRRAGGKGVSDAQARASALGEAIERYSGVFQGDEPCFEATAAELGEDAFPPDRCMLYSQQQLAQRELWNKKGAKIYRVSEAFEPLCPISWTAVWSLTAAKTRYLPTAYCYYGCPDRSGGRFAFADSNGCAAGNTIEEAVLQGFLELVERDCIALWWYNRLRRPGVDLEAFADPHIARIQKYYELLDRELVVLDLTSDLGIPAFGAASRRRSSPTENIIVGFGAHLDARLALLRALTELGQSLPASGAETDGTPARAWGVDAQTVAFWRSATFQSEPYLCPDPEQPRRVPSDYPGQTGNDLSADVQRCVQRAAELGMETLVLNQSRPDAGLVVVRVIVPGLRHFWPRWGPGRLYEVPVAMKWRKQPLTEAELNPMVIYF